MELGERISALQNILLKTCDPHDKVIQALSTLSGLEMSALSPEIRKTLESHLIIINEILKKSHVKTVEDYASIKNENVEKILLLIKKIGKSLCIQMAKKAVISTSPHIH